MRFKAALLCLVAGMSLHSAALASPDGVVVYSGDLRIKGQGSGLVFPDGSIQYRAASASGSVPLSAATLTGAWNITNYPGGSGGQVLFTADGSYSVTSGVFRAAGTGLAPATGKWKVVEEMILELIPDASSTKYQTNDSGTLGPAQYYPVALVHSKERIVLRGDNSVSVLRPATP